MPALPRIVPACPPRTGVSSWAAYLRGNPCCLGHTTADPEVPRDENNILVEEEMEDDAPSVPTAAECFLASIRRSRAAELSYELASVLDELGLVGGDGFLPSLLLSSEEEED